MRARGWYTALTGRVVAIFGEGVPVDLGPGVRGGPLHPGDPLCSEWIVLALGAHTAAAHIATERDGSDDALPEGDRRFDFVITYDRALVTAAARNLLDRLL